MEIENRYTVFEYNEKASPNYRGTRFMTSYNPANREHSEINDIVAENVSKSDAHALIRNQRRDSHEVFLNELPSELRSNDTDNCIRAILEKGSITELNK
ncbi:hypothetical protein KY334_04270 [Candidatus Woesearchaeota archaeon]|nr:hypothetical protein [Candidatus Woesearchaeota archaeon]